MCKQVLESLAEELSNNTARLSVSALEVYNEDLLDLSTPDRSKPLSLVTDKRQQASGQEEIITRVVGLQEHDVKTVNQLLAFLRACVSRRVTSETHMNRKYCLRWFLSCTLFVEFRSSRSHVILNLVLTRLEKDLDGQFSPVNDGDTKQWVISKLKLVDLAGSERNKRSKATGKNLDEAKHINAGLLALGNVIHCLSGKKTRPKTSTTTHIPYR